MPDVFLIVSSSIADEVTVLMPKLVPLLQKTTAIALSDVRPLNVEVRVVKFFFASDNAAPLQILVIGSSSPERLLRLDRWALNLARTWKKFSEEQGIIWRDEVSVWPIMPDGKFLAATETSIAFLELALERKVVIEILIKGARGRSTSYVVRRMSDDLYYDEDSQGNPIWEDSYRHSRQWNDKSEAVAWATSSGFKVIKS